MADMFNADQARETIEGGIAEAQELLSDPEQLNALFEQLQAEVAELPQTIADSFDNIPLMAQMVKSYVTQEYTEVSPKVVASLVAAFLYLVKKKDLIPDNIPVIGIIDDLGVIAAAVAINKAELEAFSAWQQRVKAEAQAKVEQETVAEAEPAAEAEPEVVVEAEPQVEAEAEPEAEPVVEAEPAAEAEPEA